MEEIDYTKVYESAKECYPVIRLACDILHPKLPPLERMNRILNVYTIVRYNIHHFTIEKHNKSMIVLIKKWKEFRTEHPNIFNMYKERTEELFTFLKPYFFKHILHYLKQSLDIPEYAFIFELLITYEDLEEAFFEYEYIRQNTNVLILDTGKKKPVSSLLCLYSGVIRYKEIDETDDEIAVYYNRDDAKQCFKQGARLTTDPNHVWCLYALGILTHHSKYFLQMFECIQNIDWTIVESYGKKVTCLYMKEYTELVKTYTTLLLNFPPDSPIYEQYYIDLPDTLYTTHENEHYAHLKEMYATLATLQSIPECLEYTQTILSTHKTFEQKTYVIPYVVYEYKKYQMNKYIPPLQEESKYIPEVGEEYMKGKERFEQ